MGSVIQFESLLIGEEVMRGASSANHRCEYMS